MDAELTLAFTHLNRIIQARVPDTRSKQLALEHIEDASMRVYLATNEENHDQRNAGATPRV